MIGSERDLQLSQDLSWLLHTLLKLWRRKHRATDNHSGSSSGCQHWHGVKEKWEVLRERIVLTLRTTPPWSW